MCDGCGEFVAYKGCDFSDTIILGLENAWKPRELCVLMLRL